MDKVGVVEAEGAVGQPISEDRGRVGVPGIELEDKLDATAGGFRMPMRLVRCLVSTISDRDE